MSNGDEYEFRPRLGRSPKPNGPRSGSMKQFLKGARSKTRRTGNQGSSSSSSGFSGARRVYVQARIHRLGGSGGGAQRAHLSYLERERAGRGEERADFYNEKEEGLDGQDWLKDHADERHHFRFIVSPEDGQKLDDLKPFIRDLVGQMEIDLETRLDWIAVDHFNTEHPHTHIVMSGKRDDGRDLVMPRDYIAGGIRERGSAILTRSLGLQTERELSAKLDKEAGLRKVTRMDRVLIRQMHKAGGIDLSRVQRNREKYEARLRVLRDMGLATHEHGPRWSVDKALGPSLSAMEKDDITAQRIEQAVKRAGLDRISATQHGEYSFNDRVQGRLLKLGHADELIGSAYAIVDGLDGRVHHFDLGTSYTQGLKAGDMIEVKPRSPGALNMDQTIADVAEANRKLYSVANHRRFDPNVSNKQLRMYDRRLEALKEAGVAMRATNVETLIPNGFMDKAKTHYQKAAKRSPNIIRKLEGRSFEGQVRAFGDTWLDQQLAGTAPELLSEAGLGGEVRAAMEKRMGVHFQRGLVAARNASSLSARDMKILQREGMTHAALDIADQTGLSYRALQPGEKAEGSFKQTYQTANAKYAIIERGKEFSLIPWKDGLERMRNQQIQIAMSASRDISWTRGRSRGLSR